jgi:hypothetical protein
MARRMLAWGLVTPVAAAGILVAHALAYRLTGTAPGRVHGYLEHAPQMLAILATIGLVGLAFQERSRGRRSPWAFALVAPLGFVAQEHVERLAHTGELPWLFTTPTFLLGLALQVPVALLCVLAARRLAGTLTAARRAPSTAAGEAWLPLSGRPERRPRVVHLARPTGRGPPLLLAS